MTNPSHEIQPHRRNAGNPIAGYPNSDHRSVEIAEHVCELIAITVAAAFAVPLVELRARTRRPPTVAFARQSAMYLAHVVFGLTLTEIGRAFGRDRTTAAYACELVENRRDDPVLDAAMEALEHVCGSFGGGLSAQPRVLNGRAPESQVQP